MCVYTCDSIHYIKSHLFICCIKQYMNVLNDTYCIINNVSNHKQCIKS